MENDWRYIYNHEEEDYAETEKEDQEETYCGSRSIRFGGYQLICSWKHETFTLRTQRLTIFSANSTPIQKVLHS